MATITELYIDPASGVAKSRWARGSDAKPAGTIYTVPADLIARDPVTKAILPDQYLIFAETSYQYTATISLLLAHDRLPSERQYLHAPASSELRVLFSRDGVLTD